MRYKHNQMSRDTDDTTWTIKVTAGDHLLFCDKTGRQVSRHILRSGQLNLFYNKLTTYGMTEDNEMTSKTNVEHKSFHVKSANGVHQNTRNFDNLEDAVSYAKQLAEAVPSEAFVVFESVRVVRTAKPPIEVTTPQFAPQPATSEES